MTVRTSWRASQAAEKADPEDMERPEERPPPLWCAEGVAAAAGAGDCPVDLEFPWRRSAQR